jgi:hypothetical protein
MMKNRSFAAVAVFSAFWTGAALAEEGSFEMRQCGPDGGCASFQGYIYVGRGAPGEATLRTTPTPDPALDGRRLYVHAGAADNR